MIQARLINVFMRERSSSRIVVSKMLSSLVITILPILALPVFGLQDARKNPVSALKVDDLLIEKYNGPLNPDTFELFHHIKYLQIRKSNISSFQANFLNSLLNLKILEIVDNKMSNVAFDITGCCNNLEQLEVSESGIGNFENETLKKIGELESLKHLAVRTEKIPTLRRETLSNVNLENLIILGCDLETIENGAFEKLKKLTNLVLSYNSLRKIERGTFEGLVNVKSIILTGNSLERKLSTDMISILPSLEVLDISYNLIMELDFEDIKKVAPKLESVEVSSLNLIRVKSGGVELNTFANPRKRKL